MNLQVARTHEALFEENYDLLHRWALKLTESDQSLAEDLLHDTFIHLTLTRPELTSIDNLEGYLYVVMRNLHLSQLRKATRTPLRAMSAVEFDSVDVGMWASDPRDRLRLRDELAAVCQFACIRKETSKGGSVLILRFFHGYYPEEIAQILKSTRAVVHERLRLARAEARTYLESPEKFSFIGETKVKPVNLKTTDPNDDLRLDLRRAIYESRRGEHASDEKLIGSYKTTIGECPETREFAHIVSCHDCLETVNTLLELPPLASRYPLDTLDKDPKDRDGGSGSGGGGSKVLDTFTRRRDAYYHHEPQELCIAVNGQLQGYQKVVSGKGEMTLILDNIDQPGFVEVFSEQGLRLLMLNVEPPPSGNGKQGARVELSYGRSIDANLNFSGPHPALEVRYLDPALAAAAEAIEVTAVPQADEKDPISYLPSESQSSWGTLFGRFRFWFSPVRFAGGLAALLIVALIIFQLGPVTTVTAADILNKSAASEATQLANKERILHRTLDLEEFKDGQITSRKRIDVWQSSEKGVTARRLYDEQGRLAMGDWRNERGIQTIYSRGQAARLQPLPEKRTIGFDDAWQLSPSAEEFKAMLGVGDDATLEERDNNYVISYMRPALLSDSGVIEDGLTGATITLSKEDLHAIEQTFTVKVGTETRDYRMTEAAYEWRPVNSVAPGIFEPNVELTGEAPSSLVETRAIQDKLEGNTSIDSNINTTPSAPSIIATAALEVEIIEALNNAGAFTGEQIDVSRSVDGKIVVTGLVETASRKLALLNALATVRNNPAVRISIETVAEAEARVKRQVKGVPPNAQPGEIQRVEVTEGQNPVLVELRKRFSEEEARQFADRALSRSRTLRSSALAMRQLSGRFSAADLQTLTQSERTRWLALIRGHAQRFVSEAESLRRDLQQFFPEAAVAASGAAAISSDAEFQVSVRELYDAAVSIDRGFGRSFALNAVENSNAPVTDSAFWRQFATAVGTARSLSKAK